MQQRQAVNRTAAIRILQQIGSEKCTSHCFIRAFLNHCVNKWQLPMPEKSQFSLHLTADNAAEIYIFTNKI